MSILKSVYYMIDNQHLLRIIKYYSDITYSILSSHITYFAVLNVLDIPYVYSGSH